MKLATHLHVVPRSGVIASWPGHGKYTTLHLRLQKTYSLRVTKNSCLTLYTNDLQPVARGSRVVHRICVCGPLGLVERILLELPSQSEGQLCIVL